MRLASLASLPSLTNQYSPKMPKTKRNKVISLTATQRSASDRSEAKTTLLSSVQQCAQEYPYIWLFSLANARTAYLQEVRKLWKDSGRIFVGKNRVVAKALGEGVEDEVVKGVRGLSQVSLTPVRTCGRC